MPKTGFYTAANFTAERCLGYLISQTHALLRPQVEALFGHDGFTFSHWRVLRCLRDGVANNCADISRELSHDKGSMTRLVDQLEERGLLKRHRDGDDRRIVFLTLTREGREAVDSLVPDVVAYYNALLANFSERDIETFITLLTRLRQDLQRRESREASEP
jgi:DNA-binding MarR family transcriptional regulator